MGRDFIAVNYKLSGPQKLAVLFHELGHFLFHIPESGPAANFHNVGRRTRQEIEADIFSLCAVIPKISIKTRSFTELIYEGLPAAMLAARLEIFEKYRIWTAEKINRMNRIDKINFAKYPVNPVHPVLISSLEDK